MKKLITPFLFVLLGALSAAGIAYGSITFDNPTLENRYQNHTFFTATTTTATSTNSHIVPDRQLRVDGAEKVTFRFSRGGATGPNTGASLFMVEATPDGSTWYDVNRMLLNDLTSSATSSVTITAATSTVVASVDLTNHAWYAVRCIVIETTDGNHSCDASVEF